MDYKFIEGPFSSQHKVVVEEYLFNLDVHRQLQSEGKWKSFYVVQSKGQYIIASAHFCLHDKVASSPFRAPFGSITVARDVPEAVLWNFVEYILGRLNEHGVDEIRIVNPAMDYDPDMLSILSTALIYHGFKVSSEVSSIIEVDSGSVLSKFHRSQKRNWLKNQKLNCEFKVVPMSNLKQVYDFIAACRRKKNYSLSMTWEHMEKTHLHFPGRFIPFVVTQDQRIIAAAITIRVSSKILYDFYHDHDAAYDDSSPVVFLVAGIYDFCQKENITILDLGTSSLGGQPNFPLLHFKKMLGAKSSLKFSFHKSLK